MSALDVPHRPRALVKLLGSSVLVRPGGFAIVDLVGPEVIVALRNEVAERKVTCSKATRQDTPNDEVRGNPERFIEHIDAGPVLDDLYQSAQLATALRKLTNIDWSPLGSHTSYSHYGGGHHLGVHRDIVGCDLTVIVVIHDDTSRGHPLWLWPTRVTDHVNAIRCDPTRGRIHAVGRPGQGIVLLGGVVPHQLPRLPNGHVRVVAPLCFCAPVDS
jgi:hypothetical protein